MDEHGWNVVEYDQQTPVALIEYKARGSKVRATDANNNTLRKLADMAGLPFFIVIYDQDAVTFGVSPQNAKAKEACPKANVFSEDKYKELMVRIRGKAQV